MKGYKTVTSELSRDDELSLGQQDWNALQTLGHQMVDDMLHSLRTARERPAWQPIPEQVKQHFQIPLPLHSLASNEVYQEFLDYILPYPDINAHPRGWGWVIGSGTEIGMFADLLASGFNPNLGGGEHIANYVEAQVIDWCKDMMGFPTNASGLLVTGCSMANLLAITVARNAKADGDIKKDGLQALSRRLTLYASEDVHSSIEKAVSILGLGSDSLRRIPIDQNFRIDIKSLHQAIETDRQQGFQPFCVVGCAGTTSTGAVDDLNALADLCQQEGLWFHVDGAFGAFAQISSQTRPLVAGLGRADSLAFDLHKWMFVPHDVGCVLIRWRDQHIQTFELTPDYLAHDDDSQLSGQYWFSDFGIELSRGFRALKVWFSLKTYGVEQIGKVIQQNINQAHYLADQIRESPFLEQLATVTLQIVCFRFILENLDEKQLNELNRKLLIELQEGGLAIISNTTIRGKFALRAAINNHQSRREDVDILVDEVIRIGQKLSSGFTKNVF